MEFNLKESKTAHTEKFLSNYVRRKTHKLFEENKLLKIKNNTNHQLMCNTHDNVSLASRGKGEFCFEYENR